MVWCAEHTSLFTVCVGIHDIIDHASVVGDYHGEPPNELSITVAQPTPLAVTRMLA